MAIFSSEEATFLGGERAGNFIFVSIFFVCVHLNSLYTLHWKCLKIWQSLLTVGKAETLIYGMCKRIILVINELHPFLEINTAGASLNTAILSNSMR